MKITFFDSEGKEVTPDGKLVLAYQLNSNCEVMQVIYGDSEIIVEKAECISFKINLWTELTEDNEPEKECLAIGYQNEMLIGYIEGGVCESESEILEEVTHFIDLSLLR